MEPNRTHWRRWLYGSWLLTAVLAVATLADAVADAGKIGVLRIGTSGTLATEGGERNDKNSMETLKSFIKDETGLDNEIARQKRWQDLAEKMSKGELHVGVFQGYEFARAQPKYPDLVPLAVSVNVDVYPVAHVTTRRDDRAADFPGLQGRSLALLADGPGYLRLFLDRQCQAAGKKPDQFFSKVSSCQNYEDALDDVVDGAVDVAIADKAALDAYKRRKPGRYAKLKRVAESERFPPTIVAYYGSYLDDTTRRRFRDGLLGASGKEKGQTMLTLFRLTGFQEPPADFAKVLAATRDAYPETDSKAK